MATARYFVGVDSGGTFTDVVAFDTASGEIWTLKVSSTPDDPSRAFFDGIDQLAARFGIGLASIDRLIFGTTVATNAILEYKGAPTALVVTAGNRDLLEIQRQNRTRLYDLYARKPKPLVPRRWSFGIAERVGADGEVVQALADDAIASLVELVRASGVESVAISFLFSFLHPVHEQRVAEAIQAGIPGIYLSRSSEVCPEFREYERTSTVVANAYVMPKIDRLAARLESGLAGRAYAGSLRIIQSNGGLMSCAQTRVHPVRTLLSGPAGGVVGAAAVARTAGVPDVITMDMGGTSLDVAVIEGGRVGLAPEGSLAGFPLKVPQVNVHTIGAGGGSIARFHRGRLRVGPESAGAVPGPVCYGRGGDEPTSTDAAVALGYIDPDYFLGGEVRLDRAGAEAAIRRAIAEPIGLDMAEAAMSIVRVQVATMAKGIRAVTVQKGLDPRAFTLMPFGGAGSLYAGLIAEDVGIRTILVPVQASVLSALGMLMTDVKYTQAVTRNLRQDAMAPAVMTGVFDGLEGRIREMFASEGLPAEAIRFERSCDMRYFGQGYEINVPVPGTEPLDAAAVTALIARFHAEHRRIYGHSDERELCEVMSFRMAGVGTVQKSELKPLASPASLPALPLKGRRPAYFGQGRKVDGPVYERAGLVAGHTVEGPAFVEDRDTVIVVYPGHRASVDGYGNLHIQVPVALG